MTCGGLALVRELQVGQTSRDQELEFSFRADGSMRVSGLHMLRGRTLSGLASRWGKSATVQLGGMHSAVLVDFRDDVGWQAVASVVAESSEPAPRKLLSAVEARAR